MFLYYFNWESRISCSFFLPWFLSLSGLFTVLINTNWELEIWNHPFHLLLTCNLAFSIIFIYFFYFSERAESNEKFFSTNQEVILSASLVGFCLIVIVGVMLHLFERRYCYDKKRKLFQLIFLCKDRFRSRTIEFKFRPVAVTSQAPIFYSKPVKFKMENRSFW